MRSTRPRTFTNKNTGGGLVLVGAGYGSDRDGSSSSHFRLERQVLDAMWRLTASGRTIKRRVLLGEL
jgi:hypothetical protein